MLGDVVSLEDDVQMGEALIQPVMQGGRRIGAAPTLAAIREFTARTLDALPEPLRRLDPGALYPVRISDSLVRLAAKVDQLQREKVSPRG